MDFSDGLGMSTVLPATATGCGCSSTLVGTAVYVQYIAANFFGNADQPVQLNDHQSCKMSDKVESRRALRVTKTQRDL